MIIGQLIGTRFSKVFDVSYMEQLNVIYLRSDGNDRGDVIVSAVITKYIRV